MVAVKSMGDQPPESGRVLAGKYRLEARLGEGGFGSIWRAEHLVLHAPVAVKLIDPDVAQREGALERFLREAQATATLRSPHVVQVLDFGVEEQQPFIVMELLEGENLAQRLKRVGRLPLSEIVRIVTHVARAIDRAHEAGIVHRDLKPENVFLVNNGDNEIAKVLDFGVAKMAPGLGEEAGTRTRTGSLIGTPYYMSPEQAQGNKLVDHRTDLWALGVISFEMATGRKPFDSEALGDLVLSICIRPIPVPSAVNADIPPGFDAWFARATERDPERRYQSARELSQALLEAVSTDGNAAGLATFEDRSGRRSTSEREVPSTPSNLQPTPPLDLSVFAATILDGELDAPKSQPRSSPRNPLPSSPSATASAVPVLPNIRVPPRAALLPEASERSGTWSLVGLGLLALVAGAAAVYGAFSLVRGPSDAGHRVGHPATPDSHPPSTAAGASKGGPAPDSTGQPTASPSMTGRSLSAPLSSPGAGHSLSAPLSSPGVGHSPSASRREPSQPGGHPPRPNNHGQASPTEGPEVGPSPFDLPPLPGIPDPPPTAPGSPATPAGSDGPKLVAPQPSIAEPDEPGPPRPSPEGTAAPWLPPSSPSANGKDAAPLDAGASSGAVPAVPTG